MHELKELLVLEVEAKQQGWCQSSFHDLQLLISKKQCIQVILYFWLENGNTFWHFEFYTVCKNTTIKRLVIIKLVIVFAVVFLGHIYSDYNQIISYKSRCVSDVCMFDDNLEWREYFYV